MAAASDTADSAQDREITATRLFDAPRERVFDAIVDPKQVALWWGPNGFTNTIQTMDVRVGGEWTLVMHGPDGTDYPNRMIYTEIQRPGRLVYQHVSPPPFDMVITLKDIGGQTELTMRMTFATKQQRDDKAMQGVEVGLSQTIDRFGAFVAKPTATDTTLVVGRDV